MGKEAQNQQGRNAKSQTAKQKTYKEPYIRIEDSPKKGKRVKSAPLTRIYFDVLLLFLFTLFPNESFLSSLFSTPVCLLLFCLPLLFSTLIFLLSLLPLLPVSASRTGSWCRPSETFWEVCGTSSPKDTPDTWLRSGKRAAKG